MKKIQKRIIAILLVIGILSTSGLQTFATVILPASNETIQQQMVQELAETYGEETAAVLLEQMIEMGIVDDSGNALFYNITMDGRDCTLDEIQALLDDESTDLTQEITVGDQTVTLEDFGKMLEIEAEIARIYATYADGGVELTEEHQVSLSSLYQQLSDGEVVFFNDNNSDSTLGGNYVSRDARVSISVDNSSIPQGEPAKFTLTLNETPLEDVTLKYNTVDGAADADTHYEEATGAITFAKGAEGSDLTKTIEVKTNDIDGANTTNYAAERWDGDRAFIMQFYDIENALFENGSTSAAVPITIDGNYEYEDIFTSLESFYTDAHWQEAEIVSDPLHIIIKKTADESLIVYYYNLADDPFPKIKEYYEEGISDNSIFIGYEPTYILSETVYNIKYGIFIVDSKTIFTTFQEVVSNSNYDGGNLGVTVNMENIPDEFFVSIPDFSNSPEMRFYMKAIDNVSPTISSITAPDGTYKSGETVPITVQFSEPVNAGSITLNGTSIAPVESSETISYSFTYLYTVSGSDSTTITVAEKPGATDIAGNSLGSATSTDYFSDVKLDTPAKYLAFDGVEIVFGDGEEVATDTYRADTTSGTAKITLGSDTYTNWLLDSSNQEQIDGEDDNYYVKGVVGSVDGGETFIRLRVPEGSEVASGESYLFADFDISPSLDLQNLRLELYLVSGEEGSEQYTLMMYDSCYADFNVAAVIPLGEDDFEIVYPEEWTSGTDYVIYNDSDESETLGYNVTKDTATYEDDLTWSIRNADSEEETAIATIDQSGVITPTNEAFGDVIVTLTANNNGLQSASIDSETITIKAGENPFLMIKSNVNQFVTTTGKSLDVKWESNIVYKNQNEKDPPEDTTFTVTLYEGNLTLDSINDAAIVQINGSDTSEVINDTKFTIPSEILTNTSIGSVPSYTFVVETEHPFKEGTTLQTIGYIVINKPAVTLKIDRWDNRYILDSSGIQDISWSMENFDIQNGSEFEFVMYKGSEEVANSRVTYKSSDEDGVGKFVDSSETEVSWVNSEGGTFTFSPDTVDGLMDIYTVEMKAKNPTESTWSYDSMVIYAYSASALDILVDGASESALNMSNKSEVEGKSSEDILELYYDNMLSLRNVISINYKDYDWQTLYDRIAWKSSDSSTASVNYNQGSLYENIENFTYSDYAPTTEFILSGLSDGETTITATHSNTGVTKQVDVSVETLTDKLYIFQAYPAVMTELTYTNGEGETVTVSTNDTGAIAIYEESGIQSDVSLKATQGDSLYLGTVYNYNLRSGEQDSTKLAQYPVNSVRMLESADTQLYLKTSSGEAYIGEVKINGGVYKNGNYCETAQIEDLDELETMPLDENGMLNIQWDATTFWSEEGGESDSAELKAGDKLEYVLFVYTDDYNPQIIKISSDYSYSDKVKSAESIINLEEATSTNQPFIVNQTLDYEYANGSVVTMQPTLKTIGPSQAYSKVIINSTIMWLGEDNPSDADDYTAQMRDDSGHVPSGQAYTSYTYPFSSTVITEHYQILEEETMWMEPGDTKGVSISIAKADNSIYKTFSMPYRIINMLGVDSVTDSDSLKDQAETLVNNSSLSGGGISAKTVADALIGLGMSALDGTSIDSSFFNFSLSATEDPLTYKCIISVSVGNIPEQSAGNGFDISLSTETEAETSIGYGSLLSMAKDSKAYEKKVEEQYKEAKDGKADADAMYEFSGYYEGELTYNTTTRNWECRVLTGGVTAGGGVGFTWNFNTSVGPIPVTAQIGLGAAITGGFNVAVEYNETTAEETVETWDDQSATSVNDYLAKLRIYAYVSAFGGLGFDYSVVALKIGLFGDIYVNNNHTWLIRNYLSDEYSDEKLNYGTSLQLNGQVGIKFYAKFIFVSYEKILASINWVTPTWTFNNWDKIAEYWESLTGRDIKTMSAASDADTLEAVTAYVTAFGADTEGVYDSTTMESRDYLEQFSRRWIRPASAISTRSLDLDNQSPATLQTNAYYASDPEMFDDGQAFVYLSDQNTTDLNSTRAAFATKSGDGYIDQGPIDDNGYGDSSLQADGNGSFAAAAWVRQGTALKIDQGQDVSESDISLMTSSTEVMVSIYEGGEWTSKQLTDNASPDLAPVVAANGQTVFVAWRSVYATDTKTNLNFDGEDSILYRVYKEGQWSEAETLYNGSSGSVKGITAEMLQDGTAAVAYTIDPSFADNSASYEIKYSVVDTNLNLEDDVIAAGGNRVIKDIQITGDDILNQNPQLTTVNVNDESKFLLGWYSLSQTEATSDDDAISSQSDIRMALFDSKGNIDSSFPDSLTAVSDSQSEYVGSNFRFVRSTGASDINNLSIVWTSASDEATEESTSDTLAASVTSELKAVKFVQDSNRIYTSAVMNLATMASGMQIEYFDAYVSGENEIKSIILASEDSGEFEEFNTDKDNSFASDGDGDGTPVDGTQLDSGTSGVVNIPIRVYGMHTATETYKNTLTEDAVLLNYNEVYKNGPLPVNYTLTNTGYEAINNIKVQFDNQSEISYDLTLLPGASTVITPNYNVGETVTNPEYRITATFASGAMSEINDTLYLSYQDLGVASVSTKTEQDGLRDFTVTLYNDSDVPLEGSGRTVKIAFYDDNEANELLETVEISDDANLALIDANAYTIKETFDIKKYVTETLEQSEIPESGVKLYVKAWIEESGEKILEVATGNNSQIVTFNNLQAANGGDQFAVSLNQTNSGVVSTVDVTVQNMAMAESKNGNVLLTLFDDANNVLETMTLTSAGGKLLKLGSEGIETRTVSFSRQGAYVTGKYFADSSTGNHILSTFTLDGASYGGVNADDRNYTLTGTNLTTSNLTAISENSGDKIEILKGEELIGEGTGYVSINANVDLGEAGETLNSVFTVKVIDTGLFTGDEEIYTFTVANENKAATGGVTLQSSANMKDGWINSSVEENISVSALFSGSAYADGNTYSATINSSSKSITPDEQGQAIVDTITQDGLYNYKATAKTNYGKMESQVMTLNVDRTAPEVIAISMEKTNMTLMSKILGSDKQTKITAQVTDNLSGVVNDSVLAITEDGDEYKLTATDNVNEYSGIISKAYEGELYIKAIDKAGNVMNYSAGTIVLSDETPTIISSVSEYTDMTANIAGQVYFSSDAVFSSARVMYKKTSDSQWQTAKAFEDADAVREFAITIEDLTPATAYQYKIEVTNMSGTNMSGGIVGFTTRSSTPAAPKAITITSDSIQLEEIANVLYRMWDGNKWTEWSTQTLYTDLSQNSQYRFEIKVQESGVPESATTTVSYTTLLAAYISGYEDSTFRPDNSITRAEASQMLYNLAQGKSIDSGMEETMPSQGFGDIKQGDWYFEAINYLSGVGVIEGYPDGNYRADNNITRAEFLTLAAKYYGLDSSDSNSFPDVPNEHWAYGNISAAFSAGWIEGYPDGSFKPENSITRAEAVVILNSMQNRKRDKDILSDLAMPFTDVPASHWAYYETLEAAVEHRNG